MSEVKLTKNELRSQQVKLFQLERYLPTLKLKKSLLQSEISQAKAKFHELKQFASSVESRLKRSESLFSIPSTLDWDTFFVIEEQITHKENIAGVEILLLDEMKFSKEKYSIFSSPVWTQPLVRLKQSTIKLKMECTFAQRIVEALTRELREVSIRVNLFEKVLIPRCNQTIKRIKIFLQDQELSAVARAKVAKAKHRQINLKGDTYAG